MNRTILLVATLFVTGAANTQNIGIGTTTPQASAILEIKSGTKGMLPPRTTTAGRTAIAAPAKGLLVYDSTTASFWYHTGTAWKEMGGGTTGWGLIGNAGTTEANFIGTTDAQPLRFKVNNGSAGIVDSALQNTGFGVGALRNTNGQDNTAAGYLSLASNTVGRYNDAIGAFSLATNTSGNFNTAIGNFALYKNTTGKHNVAVGTSSQYGVLYYNTTGNDNVAVGLSAMVQNISGYSNVAIGSNALYTNTTDHNVVAIGDSALYKSNYAGVGGFGSENTAVGSKALFNETGGGQAANTAIGFHAMYGNTTGAWNTTTGDVALQANTTGSYNVSSGAAAMYNNTTGSNNIAVGYKALTSSKTSSGQTAIGYNALYNFNSASYASNTAIGYTAMQATTTGYDNTVVGDKALSANTTGHGNTVLGHEAAINTTITNNCTFLGNSASVSSSGKNIGYENSTALGYNALINGSNQIVLGNDQVLYVQPGSDNKAALGTSTNRWSSVWSANGTIQTSDARLKTSITNTPYGLQTVMALRPVVYNWKANAGGPRMSGFIAQEVEKMVPEAVEIPKTDKEFYGMKYDALIPVLTKAIQDQQAIIEEQNKKITSLEQQMAALIKIIKK